jgi:hypothetical protein
LPAKDPFHIPRAFVRCPVVLNGMDQIVTPPKAESADSPGRTWQAHENLFLIFP